MWSDTQFFYWHPFQYGFPVCVSFRNHSTRFSEIVDGKNRFQSDPKSLLVCNQEPCDGELLTSLTISLRNFITLVFSRLIFILFLLAKTWVCHQNQVFWLKRSMIGKKHFLDKLPKHCKSLSDCTYLFIFELL